MYTVLTGVIQSRWSQSGVVNILSKDFIQNFLLSLSVVYNIVIAVCNFCSSQLKTKANVRQGDYKFVLNLPRKMRTKPNQDNQHSPISCQTDRK